MNLVSTYTRCPDLKLYRKIVTTSSDCDFTNFSCCNCGSFGEYLYVCLYVCLSLCLSVCPTQHLHSFCLYVCLSHPTPSLFLFCFCLCMRACVCVRVRVCRSVSHPKSFLISTAASGTHCLRLKLSRLSAFKTGSCGRSTFRRRTVLPRRQELLTRPSSCSSMAHAIIHQRRYMHSTSSSSLPCCFVSFNHPLSFTYFENEEEIQK